MMAMLETKSALGMSARATAAASGTAGTPAVAVHLPQLQRPAAPKESMTPPSNFRPRISMTKVELKLKEPLIGDDF